MIFIPIAIAAVLAGTAIGCSRSDDKSKDKIGPDPDTRPTPRPMPSPKPPRDPQVLFTQCFGAAREYVLIVESPGRGLCGQFRRKIRAAAPPPTGVPAPNKLGVCFPSDQDCDIGPGVRFGHPFHMLTSAFFFSQPPEVLHAAAGSLVLAENAKRNLDFWYILDGGLHENCGFFLQWWQGTAPLTSLERNLVSFEMPLYSPRKDGKTCTAEPDFSNEKILHLDVPPCASFPPPSKTLPATVTAIEVKAGADCDNPMGKTLPIKVTLQFK